MSTPNRLSQLTINVCCEKDEQGSLLIREVQRSRAQVQHRWPIPERLGDDCDILLCDYQSDVHRRLAWVPGEAKAAVILLLPPHQNIDLKGAERCLPETVLHRPYTPAAIAIALAIAWDHFSYNLRQRKRISKLESSLRMVRDIERAKSFLMIDKSIDEHKAYGLLRAMAMEKRTTIAALANSIVDKSYETR